MENLCGGRLMPVSLVSASTRRILPALIFLRNNDKLIYYASQFVRRLFIILIFATGTFSSRADGIWNWFSPGLRQVDEEKAIAKQRLNALGTPMVGQTTPEIGFQHARSSSPPLTPSWIQLDLLEAKPIDFVALIPAIVDWHSAEQPAFAFPVRFRVDVSNDKKFNDSVAVGVFTEEDFPNPGIAPVTIKAGGQMARYVRLTITKPALETRLYFFALSEIMVLSGNRNIAIGCSVEAKGSTEIPPRFSKNYLVDGRSHLGPPIRPELLKWDGLHAGEITNTISPWMRINLGRAFPIQEVRLHPVHARIGADVPGFRFPQAFRVEASRNVDFVNAISLFEAHEFSNPGDNPVTIPVKNVEAQYVKVTALGENGESGPRFSLSELEVYSDNKNVSLGSTVARSSDSFPSSKTWPKSILVDGFTSFGKLMELPVWLNEWEQRRKLQLQLKRLNEREAILMRQAQRRGLWINSGIILIFGLVSAGFVFATRFRRKRDIQDLRLRLARDIHDDIGSNLAGIAVLSEFARDADLPQTNQREDWNEINRIARETLDTMREVLWLVGVREETGSNLTEHLHSAATRMLAGKEVIWKSRLEHFPQELPLESRRQIFLFFKEALTNIVRHSGATRVELSLSISQKRLFLSITDNGCGFDINKVRQGMGLNNQRTRARSLNATLKIRSVPGNGTSILLEIPVGKLTRRLPFGMKAGLQ
jgi:signal transduction histidine kinase